MSEGMEWNGTERIGMELEWNEKKRKENETKMKMK